MIWTVLLFIVSLLMLLGSIKFYKMSFQQPFIKIDAKRLNEFLDGERR